MWDSSQKGEEGAGGFLVPCPYAYDFCHSYPMSTINVILILGQSAEEIRFNIENIRK